VRLRFAVSDALALATVLEELGGVAGDDRVILTEPSPEEVLTALAALGSRVVAARGHHRRVELVLYYSGHSDEHGLLLGAGHLGYPELRAALEGTNADVRIGILDSCASGAMLRRRGGRRVAPFLADTASETRGHAYLTSASADEAAQESDRLGGSFFTHFLVSGLRGAADTSGDGRVTLSEAYHYAFQETLATTARTLSGPQHANYDFDLTGSGDIVLTDIRHRPAALVLHAPLAGRFFVRDADDRLVAEVRKDAGRAVELGLAVGAYSVTFTEGPAVWAWQGTLAAGSRVVVERRGFRPLALAIPTRRRGDGVDDAYDPLDPELAAALHAEDGGEPAPRGTPLRLSLLPGLSLGGPGAHQRVEGLAFGLLGDEVGAVQGVQLTTAVGMVGDLLGAQLTGGVNAAFGDVEGAQLAGLVNYARGRVTGAQLALGGNYAGEVQGAQIGLVNLAGHVVGAQIGLINYAHRVDGTSLALLPLVADGYNHVEVWSDTSLPLNLGARLGAHHLHVVLSAGTQDLAFGPGCVLRVGGGVGTHVSLGRVYLDLDATSHVLLGGVCDGQRAQLRPTLLGSLRLTAGYAITRELAVFLGAAANLEIRRVEADRRFTFVDVDPGDTSFDVGAFPSAFLGVRLF